MRKLISSIIVFSLLIGCVPSQRALEALKSGNQCEYCRISAESFDSDHNSISNLGVCYDKGWCGYPKDTSKAIQFYLLAARWGVPQAKENLLLHGLQAPDADLKIAKDEENLATYGKIIAAAIVTGLAVALAGSAPASNTVNTYQPTKIGLNDDYQGCCSWHNGISRDGFNRPNCHLLSQRILCNDLQPSPTCACN